MVDTPQSPEGVAFALVLEIIKHEKPNTIDREYIFSLYDECLSVTKCHNRSNADAKQEYNKEVKDMYG